MDVQKLLFSADGRVNRQPYWLTLLAISLCSVVVTGVGILLEAQFIGVVFSVLTIVPSIMMGIKRCHDRDRSGWFLLVGLIPLVNLWLMIELLFLPGTQGPNRFGPDPLAPQLAYAT